MQTVFGRPSGDTIVTNRSPLLATIDRGASQARPSAEVRSKLEQDEWDEGQEGSNKGQKQTRILAAQVVEKLRGEQGRDRTKGVPHETLASNGGGRVLAIAVRGITVAGLENEEDSDTDESEADDGSKPVQVLVLGEAVDEQTDGQPHGSTQGTVQTGLGGDFLVRVGNQSLILADLEEVQCESSRGADAQRNVGQSRHTLIPTALLLVGDGDDGKEEEGEEPRETDPETKGKNNGLGEKHFDGLDGRVVQHLLDARGFDVIVGDETLVAGSLAEHLGPLGQSDTTTGLGEADGDDNAKGNVGKTLDTLDPSPSQSLVDETGVDRGGDSTEDGDERKRSHRDGTVSRGVHVAKGTSDQNCANTAEKTEKGTADEDGSDVLAEGETDEHQGEADIGTDVHDSPSGQFAEWCQEERCEGTGEVEAEQTELSNFGRDAQVCRHAGDA